MGGHFSAFSFVDRITWLEPGRQIRGSYRIPSGIKAFPVALVAEAVGQLAAWAAMCALDFKSRPVAGLAGSIDLLSEVSPGQELELAADLESVDEEAAEYHGSARVNGVPVIQLRHCVGPMVPIEQFDDPQALRERYALLRGAGATPEAFGGIPPLALDRTGGENGQPLHAILHVPQDAPFFADHFPRHQVLPGALLMNSNLELVLDLLPRIPAPPGGSRWILREISDMKLRAFTKPGERLEIQASLDEVSAETAVVNVETRKGKRLVGSCRVKLVPERRS